MSKKIDVNKLLLLPTEKYEIFHKLSNNRVLNLNQDTDQLKSKYSSKNIIYKSYFRFENIKLKKPNVQKNNLIKAIINRKSNLDKPSKEKLTLSKISYLLYYSVGLIKEFKRPYPSAGGLYPIEIYLISQKTEFDKKIRLFHYYVKDHSLEKLWQIPKKDLKSCFIQSKIIDSQLIILLTAVFKRSSKKYGNRSYRYIHLEAGHLSQNILLISTSLKLSACPIGGFYEDKINRLLDLDGINESVIYSIVIK
ncbi:MAG: hypothetical protein KatS3mg091_652 [Patescibacteria group bacterium]|nr:MAG: hypothetical protein KatS3mg091_652 [Patescibacteria group bacterium]